MLEFRALRDSRRLRAEIRVLAREQVLDVLRWSVRRTVVSPLRRGDTFSSAGAHRTVRQLRSAAYRATHPSSRTNAAASAEPVSEDQALSGSPGDWCIRNAFHECSLRDLPRANR